MAGIAARERRSYRFSAGHASDNDNGDFRGLRDLRTAIDRVAAVRLARKTPRESD